MDGVLTVAVMVLVLIPSAEMLVGSASTVMDPTVEPVRVIVMVLETLFLDMA